MKKNYQQPATRVIQLQHRHHVLAGSEYSVREFKSAANSETVSDDGDW